MWEGGRVEGVGRRESVGEIVSREWKEVRKVRRGSGE
jgi:hypothetical protein